MNASGSAYFVARRLGILDDLFGEKTNNTEEYFIKQFIKKHNIKSKSELENKSIGAYKVAQKLDILDDLFDKK